MAVSGFKGFGWILCGVILSPGFYLVSSKVAAERGRLERVERAIIDARHDMRTLETEFDTRANFAQLERWNGDLLALAAPRPEQFASADASLAALHVGDGNGAKTQTAALIVPSASPPMIQADAAALPAAGPTPTSAARRSASPLPVVQTAAAPAMVGRPTMVARPTMAVSAPVATAVVAPRRMVPSPRIAGAKIQAVAMLDTSMIRGKLLDDRTMGDLVSRARAEAVKR